MPAPVVKQIQGTLNGVIAIIVGAPFAGIATTSMSGELHNWHDMGNVALHSLLPAVCLACGWIFWRSPLAPTFQSVVGSMRQQSTDLAGTVTTTETKVEITKPEVPPVKTP